MELSARKQAILLAVVDAYIRTGEPVGSKALTEILENAPSSATLRNEMSELSELGYLEQPHTSAGRVPTSSAYRLYVNSLPKTQFLLEQGRKELIDSMLFSVSSDPEHIPAGICRIVSRLTGLPAISATVAGSECYLKSVKLLPLGRHTAMLVAFASNGRAKSRLCRVSSPLTEKSVLVFESLVNRWVVGVHASEFTPAFMQSIMVSAGADALTLMPILTELNEIIEEVSRATLELGGEANIFSVCDSDRDARDILSIFDHREALISMLSEASQPLNLLFGSEMSFAKRSPLALIVTSYDNGNGNFGRIGVLGPERLEYKQIIPSLSYIAKRAGDIMTQAIKDMED